MRKKILAIFIIMILVFCAGECSFGQGSSSVEKVEKAEKALNIQSSGSLIDRIKRLENKLFGQTYSGSIIERCDRIDSATETPGTKPESVNIDQSGSTISLSLDQNSQNPLKYIYNTKFENYLSNIDTINNKLADLHFKSFPIKVWIRPADFKKLQIIRNAVSGYSKYLPIVEVKSKDIADIIIATGKNEEPDMNTKFYFEDNRPRGKVFILEENFEFPKSLFANLTISHEFGHSLGLPDSNNPDDVMYNVPNFKVSSDLKKATQKDTGKEYDVKNLGKPTAGDLNTLWLLYNQY